MTVIGALVLFTKVWAGIILVPLLITPAIPAGGVLDQEILAPAVGELIVISAEVDPEQIVCAKPEN